MHGHPLQKDSYRLLDFTVAVGTSTHAGLPHIDSLAPEPCAQAGKFISNIGFITQAGFLAHRIQLYVPFVNSRTESSDHLAVDTFVK